MPMTEISDHFNLTHMWMVKIENRYMSNEVEQIPAACLKIMF